MKLLRVGSDLINIDHVVRVRSFNVPGVYVELSNGQTEYFSEFTDPAQWYQWVDEQKMFDRLLVV